MKTLIFGGRGYLGEQFKKLYPDAVAPDADIADAAAVAAALDAEKPDIVINAAGKTGRPNIDWCEDHKIETVRSNVTGPLVLLEECAKRGIYWVHLSSGCIYAGDNGGKGFSEEDPPNFDGSFYSRTKAWADRILLDLHDDKETSGVLILRLRMPFDDELQGRNLIAKLLKYRRVLDVENSLTYIPDFLEAARVLIERRRKGVFNVVNPGPVSPYRIMQWYKEGMNPAHEMERLTLEQLDEVTATGRSNCVLRADKIRKEGISMHTGEEAVRKALQAMAEKKPS
jgi:dTDP-4-dehydrorhamnose reductase